MRKTAVVFLFSVGCAVSPAKSFANSASTDVLFEKDLEANPELAKEYPIKICVGPLGYSGMEAKTQDDPRCEKQKEIPYEECMRQRVSRANFKLLVINKDIKVQPKEVIFLKRKKYSFLMGASGFQKNFSKEENTTFKLDTANYGGVAIDSVKNCKHPKIE